QIPQETFGEIFSPPSPPAKHRQELQWTIVAAFQKFGAKIGRPILRTHFPTVKMQHGQSATRVAARTNFGQQFLDVVGEMCVERRPVKLVTFKAQPRRWCGPGGRAGERSAKPHDGPLTRRHLPVQMTVEEKLLRQIYDIVWLDTVVCR